MLKTLGKFIFMIELGYKHIKIFKRTYFHPFISLKPGYKQLSVDRQSYSNGVVEFLNIEIELIGEVPSRDRILYAINHRSLLDIIVMEHVFQSMTKMELGLQNKNSLTRSTVIFLDTVDA